MIELFSRGTACGVFKGFTQGGLEFHADLVLPYRSDFQNTPMHGQFILVQLESPDEAVLGRIASFSAEGRLSYGAGEEYNIRAVTEERNIPEELREQYLRYRVNIRVLGVLRNSGEHILFAPSHRRLPHVGSAVAFPNEDVLKEIAGHNENGAEIGHFALGEYVYAGDGREITLPEWSQSVKPETIVRFAVDNMVSRRTFCFARAGFGKSNLTKLLFSTLYNDIPTIHKRGRNIPIGTIIFDPDGEYFWPDDRGRPGLCDVPNLEDKVVVFTNRQSSSSFYQSFVAGAVRLDIRRWPPSDVVGIALSPERQEQQNVRKLRGLPSDKWEELVDLIYSDGNQADIGKLSTIMNLEDNQQAEAFAARANMTHIVRMLHDPSSQLMDRLIQAISEGRLCIVDMSQMRGQQSMIFSGLILRRIFDRNQQEFTSPDAKTIPTIAVIEEAQSVLVEKASASEPFIAWVKEGRKYDLGAMLITQQPGSLPQEILSQGDNWFIFHLLSAGDLATLKKANAHFSDDLLSSILNEPIPGHGLYWSSVHGKPYPLSMRVTLFEDLYKPADVDYYKPAANTWAIATNTNRRTVSYNEINNRTEYPHELSHEEPSIEVGDYLKDAENAAIENLRDDLQLINEIKSEEGIPWGKLNNFFEEHLPETFEDRKSRAYKLVPKALNAIFGDQGKYWRTFRNQSKTIKNGKYPMYITAFLKDDDEKRDS